MSFTDEYIHNTDKQLVIFQVSTYCVNYSVSHNLLNKTMNTNDPTK